MAEDSPRPKPRRRRAAKPRTVVESASPAVRTSRRRPARPAAVAASPAVPVAVAAEAREAPALRRTGTGAYEWIWRTGLLNVGSIARRELGAFFVSPIGYVIGAIIIIPVALFGYIGQLATQSPLSMSGVFAWVTYLSVLMIPLFTMRLLAEERRSGTLELLLTSPVRDWELVVGKWLGALLFYLAITAFLGVFLVLMYVYQPLRADIRVLGMTVHVANLDYGTILTGYVGLILAGGAYIAIGILLSSLTSNQIIAAFAAFVVLIVLHYGMAFLSSVAAEPYRTIFDYAGGNNRYLSFGQGRFVLKDVLYFVTLIVGGLFLTTRVLESRKWR